MKILKTQPTPYNLLKKEKTAWGGDGALWAGSRAATLYERYKLSQEKERGGTNRREEHA